MNKPTISQMVRVADNADSSEFDSHIVGLIDRLRTRAAIRRQIATRKSVQEGRPDRLADLLDEAADALDKLKGTNGRTTTSIA
jgi:hypothetical protein